MIFSWYYLCCVLRFSAQRCPGLEVEPRGSGVLVKTGTCQKNSQSAVTSVFPCSQEERIEALELYGTVLYPRSRSRYDKI